MPVWISIVQALSMVAIGIFTATIAVWQWKTANAKVVMDLFDRRMTIYDEVHDCVLKYLHEPSSNLSGYQAGTRLYRSWATSRFLFGRETPEAIDTIRRHLVQHASAERKLHSEEVRDDKRSDLAERIETLDILISEQLTAFSDACYPYLRMDQKRIRTVGEWFHDKNRQRLSYTNET